MHASRSVEGIVKTETEVECAQRVARNVVYLALQERTERIVHRHLGVVVARDIHARGEHCHSQFAPLLLAHGVQFVLHGHVRRCRDGEPQSHLLQRVADNHTAVEIDTTALLARSDTRLGALCGSDVEPRIHRVARELYVTAVLYGERLERNDRHRVFHLAVVQRVFSPDAEVVGWCVLQSQGALAHQIDIVRMVWLEIAYYSGGTVNVDGQVHVESHALRLPNHHLRGVGEVGEAHQFFHLVIGGERRVAQYVRHVGGAQHIHSSTQAQIVERAAQDTPQIDIRLAVSLAAPLLLRVDEQEVLCRQPYIEVYVVDVGKVDVAVYPHRVVVGRV